MKDYKGKKVYPKAPEATKPPEPAALIQLIAVTLRGSDDAPWNLCGPDVSGPGGDIVARLGSTRGAARNVLEDLTRLRPDTRSLRISSFDKSGGNNDRLEKIAQGERRTLADIKGPGRSTTSG